MITQQELLTLFSTGTCVRTPDKFLIHTSTGRLVEVSAEAVRAYLKKDFNGALSIDADGYVTIDGVSTGYKLQPVDLTNLETRMDGLEADMADFQSSGSGCKCSVMGDHLETPIDTTQIKVKDGDDMKYITMADIKSYLADEYAPQWTDATCSISLGAGFASVMEIGSARPTSANFTISGSPAKAVSAGGTATGGSVLVDNVSVSYNEDTKVLTATGTRTYSAGTAKVLSSKSNPTNKTASNSTTLLSYASVNSNINASAFNIMQMTKTATTTIQYVYAFWANAASITSIVEQTLTAQNYIKIVFAAETKTDKHTFDIPAAYTITSIKVHNTLSDKDENYVGSWTTSDVTHQDAAGTDVAYKRYVRNDGTNGSTQFTIYFTK